MKLERRIGCLDLEDKQEDEEPERGEGPRRRRSSGRRGRKRRARPRSEAGAVKPEPGSRDIVGPAKYLQSIAACESSILGNGRRVKAARSGEGCVECNGRAAGWCSPPPPSRRPPPSAAAASSRASCCPSCVLLRRLQAAILYPPSSSLSRVRLNNPAEYSCDTLKDFREINVIRFMPLGNENRPDW